MEAECWNCGAPVKLDEDQFCPQCGVQLPRFVIKIKLCETTHPTPRFHPDPLKRLEGAMATRFREFLIKEIALLPDEALPISEPYLPPVIPAPPRIIPIPPTEPLPPGTPLAGMIHHAYIIDARGEFVVNEEFWNITVEEAWITDFAECVKDAQDTLIEEINGTKLIGKPLGRGIVVLSADSAAGDATLREKLDRVTYEFRRVISHEIAYDDFIDRVDDYVTTTCKISIIGYGGVGKTDIVTLLNGGVPPTEYTPTIAIDIQRIEDFRIGTLEISTWDFPSLARFRKLWELYFRGSRIILLVTDSTLENVQKSKNIIDFIRRKNIAAQVLAIAYRQDRPGALSLNLVQRFLGIKALGLTEGEVRSGDPATAMKIITEAMKLAAPKKEPETPKPEMVFD
ncbi:MAG: ADP-ribosylation factor-like protein [Candidatus Hodarchaeota archaeon]